jgi:tetratricopeptide (TPR) repeat protein
LTIVHSITQDHALPDSLAQTIIAKAEGNPFFLEELTRAVIEPGALQAETTVPERIQGVLMARMDRLPEEPKRLLQTASVLGREFSPTLLEAMWEGAGALGPLLSALTRVEFLYERPGAAEPTYVFKHALTQDVAYASLLTQRRQTLHEAAGQALEALYADRLADVHNQLAYHYARTANAAKAVAYLTLVAEKAAQGYAHAEAVASLQEALHHAERLPAEERDYRVLDLVVRQGEPLFLLGRRQELIDLFLGQQERLERLQEPLLAGLYSFWLGFAYSFLGKRELATQSFHRALAEGTRGGDVITMGKAHCGLQNEMMFAGPLPHSIAHGHQAASLLEATDERRWLGVSLYTQGIVSNMTGDFQQALEVATRVHAIGETIGDRRLLANAVTTLGWSYTEQGAWEAGIEALQHASAISPDAFVTALILGNLGYAYMVKGDLAQAIPILEQAVQQADQYRSRQVQSMFRTCLGEAYHVDDQNEKAGSVASQGLALAEAIKFPWGIGRAQRILGRIALTSGNHAEAASYLQNALETLASIHACFEQARTHLDLASLAHTQGNQDTTTTHLSTAFAWFKKLQVPKWMERTEQLAQEYGVTLTEVALEELTEEPS